MKTMYEVLLTIILPIILVPILIGALLGWVVGASGRCYCSIIILCMSLCWGIFGLYIYK